MSVEERKLNLDMNALNFARNEGVVTVIAQDDFTGAVLMVAGADRTAVERTLATGEMHYTSRTRGLWHKGSTSGNTQRVVSLTPDCDGDAVLARVVPAGPACHTGEYSCFRGNHMPADPLRALDATISERAERMRAAGGRAEAQSAPHERQSYTVKLLRDRNLRLKKIGEESGELIAACADGDAARATEEAADVVYHVAVALSAVGSSLTDVTRTLANRARGGGGGGG